VGYLNSGIALECYHHLYCNICGLGREGGRVSGYCLELWIIINSEAIVA
jgi:hypothetical protein